MPSIGSALNPHLFNTFSHFIQRPFWQLKLSVILFGFIFITTYPRYFEILADRSPEKNHAYYFSKINHPLTPIVSSKDSHGSKVAFRLTIPLFAKALNLTGFQDGRAIVILYIIQSLLCIVFLYLILELTSRFMEPVTSMIFTIGLSGIYLSKSFFWDYDFWFDGYAYFLLLCGMASRRKPVIGIFLFLACWTDERAAVALCFVWIFHLLQENQLYIPSLKSIFSKETLTRPSTMVLAVGLVYIISRLFIKYRYNLSTPVGTEAGVSLSIIPYQLKHRGAGIFLAFEGMYLPYLAALLVLFRLKKYFIFNMLIFSMILQIIIAYSVFDITRSLTYAFPLIITSVMIVARHAGNSLSQIILFAAALSLCVPTQYVIFHTHQVPWTIFSLPEIWSVVKTF